MDKYRLEIERRKIISDYTVLLLSLSRDEILATSSSYLKSKLDAEIYKTIDDDNSLTIYKEWAERWGEDPVMERILNYRNSIIELVYQGSKINVLILERMWERYISYISNIIIQSCKRSLILHELLKKQSQIIYDYDRELGLFKVMNEL